MMSILNELPLQAEEIDRNEEPRQFDVQDAMSEEQQVKNEQNVATYGTNSVEIFKKDFDKSVATAEKTEHNEEQQAYVTADTRNNIDSYRVVPKTVSQYEATEKEPKYPQFSQRGTAPFEKSDNKNQKIGSQNHSTERQPEDRRRVPVQPPQIAKTRQTNEDDKKEIRFLNSKKYGSEGPLNEQPYSISTKTPGAQSQGNLNSKGKKTKSENKSKSRKATDASYFNSNKKSNTTFDGPKTTKTDQMPHQTRNALSSQDLPLCDPEYKKQSVQSQDFGAGTLQKGI